MSVLKEQGPDISRRGFLKVGGLTAGGLVVGFAIPSGKRLQAAHHETFVPNAYLSISSDNTVKILLSKSEMGQGVWTTLPMLIAEELEADWSKIQVEHAPAGPAYMNSALGAQVTGGSTSTWSEFDRYRQAGAVARVMLIQAAAERFGVKPEACRAENGWVIAGDQKASYGELAEAAAALEAPAEVPLKDAKDWKVIGTNAKRLDTPEKINGSAVFGMDVQFDGLKTAVVERSPVFGGSVKSYDAEEALKVPGVQKVVQVPSGVAVVADHFWAAKLGRDALKVDWDLGEGGSVDTSNLREEWSELAATPGLPAAEKGDPEGHLGKASKTLDAEYAVPYLAHAPMEPLNCTVKVTDNQCDIWAGTQFQTMDQGMAAGITGLPPEKVHVHTAFLGGGFGRRAVPNSDFVAEAVHVAQAAGMPIKTVWTRDNDVRGGWYRSAFVHRARIGLGDDGMPVAWQHNIVGQSIATGTVLEPMLVQNGIDNTSVEGVSDSPYLQHVPHHRVGLHSPQLPIPVLWWRSVGHSHNAFAMECLIDEIAHASGKDPVELRRHLLKGHSRHLGVMELAAEKAGWGGKLPEGRAHGIAVHESFGSFAAQVAEVSVDRGQIQVHKVTCAIDCGIAVNPHNIAAQMESGIVFGLSAALLSQLDLRKGRVRQSNFHNYRVLRMKQMPVVETHVVQSTEKPGGIGEVSVPPIAPAVANAVATLTGQRLRELPLRLS